MGTACSVAAAADAVIGSHNHCSACALQGRRACAARSPVVKRMKEGFSLGWNTRVTSDLLYYTRSSSAGKVMWVARQAIGLRRRQVRPRRSAANSTAILRVTALYSRRASSRGGCRALQLCSCNGSTALQPLHSTALYSRPQESSEHRGVAHSPVAAISPVPGDPRPSNAPPPLDRFVPRPLVYA